MQYPRRVDDILGRFPHQHTDLRSVRRTARRRPALSHFSRNTEAGSNMSDRPVSRLASMFCFLATPRLSPDGDEPSGVCLDVTPPPFGWLGSSFRFLRTAHRLRRYAHAPDWLPHVFYSAPYCGTKQNAPVLLFSRRKPLLTNDVALY